MERRCQLQRGRLVRGVVSLAILAICIRIWTGPASVIEPAQAQLPDSAMQRRELLEEAKRTNQLLGQIRQLLQSHTFNVRIAGADNQADVPTGHQGR